MVNTLYIGFSARKGFNIVSWLIRKFQGTPYSHVYIRIPSESLQRDLIYQSSGLSVHFSNYANLLNKSKVIKEYILNVTPETKIKTLQFAIDNLEKPYSMLQLVGFVWVSISKWFGKKVSNPFKNGPESFICSELVATVLEELGYDLEEDLDSISPKDIDKFLQEQQIPCI